MRFLALILGFVFYTHEMFCAEHVSELCCLDSDFKRLDFSDCDKEKVLYIYIGIDYMPDEVIELFQKLSGIRVIVDVFDSNEILEAKLLAGGEGYDIVFPTAFPYFSRQLASNIYQKIDVSKFDFNDIDQDLLKKLSDFDKNNEYCIPFQWGISGIGVNKKILEKLVPDAPMDSLSLVFEEKYISKLSKYGVSLCESQDELFPMVLAYLGRNPENCTENDVKEITDILSKIRKYIFKFTNYGFEDLSSGNACLAFGTSGDIKHIQMQQIKSTGKTDIEFIIPKEGVSLWIDVAAVPSRAKHFKNAMLFLQFLLLPKVSAYIVNRTTRATCTISSKKYVDSVLANDTTIYPTHTIKQKSYIEKYTPGYINNIKTRALTKIKSFI